jgi:ubiquinone/menaquinone biosynthesis C-methylase UbiE
VAGSARRILDIGTGTGTLSRAAVRRWPEATVTGVDISSGMVAAADAEADRILSAADRRRLETRVAPADALPFSDGAFDVAISSFVFQLVPNRFRALREARRILRPGGVLAYVTWLVDDRAFPPDELLDRLLDTIGVGAREHEDRPGDIPTADAAAAQLRRTGFRDVTSERAELEYQFTVDRYLGFLTDFDEKDLIASLTARERRQVLDPLRDQLSALPPRDLLLRYPIVYATGRRP